MRSRLLSFGKCKFLFFGASHERCGSASIASYRRPQFDEATTPGTRAFCPFYTDIPRLTPSRPPACMVVSNRFKR